MTYGIRASGLPTETHLHHPATAAGGRDGQKVEELSAALKAIQEQNESIMKAASASHTLFAEIRPVVADLATWKPHLEQSVADLRQELGGVRQEIDLIARNPVLALKPSDLPPILPRPSSVPFPNGGSSSQGPDGHRIDLLHRGVALGLLPPYSRLRPRVRFHAPVLALWRVPARLIIDRGL